MPTVDVFVNKTFYNFSLNIYFCKVILVCTWMLSYCVCTASSSSLVLLQTPARERNYPEERERAGPWASAGLPLLWLCVCVWPLETVGGCNIDWEESEAVICRSFDGWFLYVNEGGRVWEIVRVCLFFFQSSTLEERKKKERERKGTTVERQAPHKAQTKNSLERRK